VGRVRYVPDWVAIGAVCTAAVVVVSAAGVWYSIRAVRQQLRHQRNLEAKHLEQELLLRVLDLVALPYYSALDFVTDVTLSQLPGGPSQSPEFMTQAARKPLEAYRKLSAATASLLSVLRRSRPRRFPRQTHDQALEQYDDLVERVNASNAKLLNYVASGWAEVNLTSFQEAGGSEAFEMSNVFRRITGDLLARMYSDEHEWLPFQFERQPEKDANGLEAVDFVDDPPLGTK
jgi:hypothetical protein